MLLPGRKASVFRKNLADLFIRVLGGDERLAEEIKEIGEFQDALPDNHPLRAFRDNVPKRQYTETTTSNVIRVTKRPFADITNENTPPKSPQLMICEGIPINIVSKGTTRPGQQKFRKLVMTRVRLDGELQCEATGASRDLDAAHIVPYKLGGHGSWATNGLLLHRSLHTIWDAGLVTLSHVPPFRWVDIDNAGIEKMYGGLAPSIIDVVIKKSLRSNVLSSMSSLDQLEFIHNLKTRFELAKKY